MKTATSSGRAISFTYNKDGIRTSKTVNGVTTTYYLNGSQILGEETNGNVTLYVYDASGSPIGMQYHGANYADGVWDVYWYEKNIFGDIIAVYDEEGTKLASYVYDAWGNPNQTEHNGGFEPATINPFRYRGYYYDVHLRFYYLNTRYYDPYGYRFLSPDSYVSTGQGILSYNMYAYCNNNPVMNVDPNGDLPKWLKWIKDFLYNIDDAVWGSVEAEAGFGIGVDVNGTGAYRDFYVGIDDKQLVAGNIIEAGIGNNDLGLTYTADHLSEKGGERVAECGRADDNILSMLTYPETTHSFAFKSGHLSINTDGDFVISASISGHILLGGHASASVNVTDFFRRLLEW